MAFWQQDGDVLFADERHQREHARLLGQDYMALLPCAGAAVLEFGPGRADTAPLLATHCARLFLSEAADQARTGLAQRFADHANIQVISPAEMHALPPASIDLILVHSVVQYLSPDELPALIGGFTRLLSAKGILLIGDVLPRRQAVLADVRDLLAFAWQGGFLIPALLGLLRLSLSPYRHYRQAYGLARYDDADMLTLLQHQGLVATRLPTNIGHSRSRVAYLAAKTDDPLTSARHRYNIHRSE